MSLDDLHHFEIDSADGTGRSTNVKLDGKQLWSVQSVDIHIDGNSLIEVTLKMDGDQLSFDSLAAVGIDPLSVFPPRQRKWYHLWLK